MHLVVQLQSMICIHQILLACSVTLSLAQSNRVPLFDFLDNSVEVLLHSKIVPLLLLLFNNILVSTQILCEIASQLRRSH